MSYQETNEKEVIYMFTAWLEKLLHYAKLDYIKKEKNSLHVISLELVPEYYLSNEPTIKSETLKFENEILEEAFLSLTETRRKVILLYFIEGFTIDEIAILLNSSVKNVRKIKERALSKLRNFLMSVEENEWWYLCSYKKIKRW